MLRKSYYILLLVAVLLLLPHFSCSLDDDEPDFANNMVVIRDNSFNPPTITVGVGRAVVWQHQGSDPHTVTSGTPTSNPGALFESGVLVPTQVFQYTYTQSGTYNYFCRLHGTMMAGVVNVQ